MLDLTEIAVAAWFAPVRPPSIQNNWPPAIRPLERAPTVQPLLEALGSVLSEVEDETPAYLPAALTSGPVWQDLQTVVAQLGGARLLRIVDWIVASQPEAPRLIAELSRGGNANGPAIRSSIRALTARAALTRMFSPDRAADLQSCTEAATNPQENT